MTDFMANIAKRQNERMGRGGDGHNGKEKGKKTYFFAYFIHCYSLQEELSAR
jgi:hypothetical protein